MTWLTLDAEDNDPAVLLTYLAAALDRVEPIDASLGFAIAAPRRQILSNAVPCLASELHRWRGPAVLVLDEAHRLLDRISLDALAASAGHQLSRSEARRLNDRTEGWPAALSFPEIGDRLFISRNTVKTQALSIYGKLQVSSRGETVEWAVELGLLDPLSGPELGPRPPIG